MYAINTPNSHWTLFKAWLDSQNLVQGQDWSVSPSVENWTMLVFNSQEHYDQFVLYSMTLSYS
jgi:hypothetical protein